MKKISRKEFIKLSSLVAGGTLLIPKWLYPFFSDTNNFNLLRNAFNDKILVVINLNGGNDGLNTVIPYQNQNYYNLRPDIAIPNDSVLPITDELGLHPSLSHLANFWNQGKLCIVENVGYSNQNLSHFRSTDIWQSGSESDQVINTGWIARVIEQVYPNHVDNLPEIPTALLQGTTNNLLLNGSEGITGMMVEDPSTFYDLVSNTVYNSSDNIIPETSGGNELEFIRGIDNSANEYAGYIQNASNTGQNTVEYDNNRLSAQLSTAAKLISGGMYSPFYIVYQAGYDTHADQLNRQGLLLSELSNAINNFYIDLENQGLSDKVVIMTTSEFGRRPYQNGGEGTDHGTAAPMFLVGESVNGGIIGNAPNLDTFDNNNNLFHEHDFRQIYASVLNQHFGLSSELINNALLNSFETLDVISTSNNQIGDINLDGQTNVVDIVIMVNFILGVSTPTNQQFNAADINQDGELNIVDVVTNISNILDERVGSSIISGNTIKIEHKNRLISIPENDNLGGVEIHFRDNCTILDSKIDNSWIIRNYKNKVVLYSNDLKTMNQNFTFMLDKYSKIEKIIISDKKGSLLKSRIYKK